MAAKRKANREAIKEIYTLFPTLKKGELGHWLMVVSAVPFQPVVDCMPEIRRLAKRAKGQWDRAISIADMDTERVMKKATSRLKRATVKQKKNKLRGK